MPSLGAAAEAEAFQEAPHAGVAVVGLGEHAMQVMVVDEGRDDRAEGLGRQARALAAGRERDVHLGGPRLVGKGRERRSRRPAAARSIKRCNLHPRARCAERYVGLRG